MALKDVLTRIRGTMSTIFQLGKAGPNIKNNSGIIEMRNNADAAFVITRGLSPVGNDDYVTKLYFDTNNAAANGLTLVVMPLALVTKVSTSTIPDNARIEACWLEVTTPYDGGTTVKIARTGDATVEPMGTADNNPVVSKLYHVPQMQDWGATGAGTVTATIAGGPAAGAANIYIAYSTPTDIS